MLRIELLIIVFLCISVLFSPCKVAAEGAGEAASMQKGDFSLVIKVSRTEAYPGEKVPLAIRLSADSQPIRNLTYPVFSHKNLLTGDFESPVEGTETKDGVTYKTVLFKTDISGQKTGLYRIGPAVVEVDSLQPAKGFFGGHEAKSVSVMSEEIYLKILPFPADGRPPFFNGAVGKFDIRTEVRPVKVDIGQPISVKTTISGKGNLDSVDCPDALPTNGFRIYQAEKNRNINEVACEQVFMPVDASVKEIPQFHFSYFDPEIRRYRTLKEGPTRIWVAAKNKGRTEDVKTTDIQLKKEREGEIYKLVRIIFPLTVGLLIIWMKRGRIGRYVQKCRDHLVFKRGIRKRLKDAERALLHGSSDEFYTIVFRMLQDCLGYRLGIQAAGITVDIVSNRYKSYNQDDLILEKVVNLFEESDSARYGSMEISKDKKLKSLSNLNVIVKEILKSAY